MGKTIVPSKAKLVCGLIYNQAISLDNLRNDLEHIWGPIDCSFDPVLFEYTSYYNQEMGAPLLRTFWSFHNLIERDTLADKKLQSNQIELKYAESGKRPFNLDPGYLTLAQLVLATTKDRDHRIYVGKGIFAEITLRYSKNYFHAFPWTYRDYATPEYERMFLEIRRVLVEQLKE